MPRTIGRTFRHSISLKTFIVCAAALLAAPACTTSDQAGSHNVPPESASGDRSPPPYQPVQFAMPSDAEIDRDNTLVVGDSVQWYGTLSLTTDLTLDDTSAYYARRLPAEGWEPLSSLISNRVVLQFVNRERRRAAIVTIESGNLWSRTHVEIVVAPLVAKSALARDY